MAAAITDLITQATTSSRPTPTQVTSTRSAAGATLACNALTGWPTATAVHFCTYKVNTSGAKIAGSQIDMKGIVSGTNITNITIKAGTDVGNAVGDIVEAAPTAAWANDVVSWGTAQHGQDGSHAVVTATSVAATGNISSSAGTINAATVSSLQDASVALSTYRVDSTFDYVVSGGVWSGDAYASTRNASITAIVCWVNGQRLSIGAVTARSFTASKDTYIDVLNTSGVGSLVYTEVTNNAASPALAANSIRIGIIVTGATNIAAATSVNQGQETMVLPIASSVPYAVTDSLGNLICPRDPSRQTLGYRQIVGNVAVASTTGIQVTGLSCPVIVPTGRKVEISVYNVAVAAGSANPPTITIWDGVVGSGTQLQQYNGPSGGGVGVFLATGTTPATTSKTYNVGAALASGNVTFSGSTSFPSYIRVKLA